MRRYKIWLFATLLLFNIHSTIAADVSYKIDHITAEDGISQNDVLDIFQDSFGFVWIATNDGLNRYDGVEFKLFTDGQLGLESSLILNICEDRSGNLWIATADRGVYYYLRNENRFVHISQMCDDSRIVDLETTRYITMGDGDELWLYARMSKSIIKLKYNSSDLKVNDVMIFPLDTMTTAHCSGLTFVDGDIYASTNWGLLRYSHREQKMERIQNVNHTIQDIARYGSKLYLATPVGLFSYDFVSGVKQKIFDGLENLFRICWDNDDLYIATKQGLYVVTYNSKYDIFTEPRQVDSYPNFNTNKLLRVNTGGIWAGFDKESIRVYQHNTKPFEIINSFGNNHIVSLYVDSKDHIWVGTEGSGYFCVDDSETSDGSITNFMDGVAVNAISYADYNSKYYIATNNGIYKHSGKGDERRISAISTTKSLVADGRYLWMACYSEGLKRVDLDTEKIESFVPSNSALKSDIMRCVLLGRDGNLWVTTSKGLFMIEQSDKASERPTLIEILPDSTESHYIVPLYQSRAGDIWYGTLGMGLYRIVCGDDGNYSIETYTTDNILPNNTVKAITEDRNGVIWVSLNSGICAIDVERQSAKSYDINNGLKDGDFHDLVAWCTDDNRLLFGGVRGVTMFNPNDIAIDYTQGTPRLTNIEIFNRSIFDIEGREKITPLALEATEHITLTHNQNSFTLSFSSFNYTGSKRQRYLYKLEGFDRDWQLAKQNRSEASYTNIPFGDYRFVVRCMNEDGVINPDELVVELEITPPFWLTIYAILMYIVILITIFLVLTKYYKMHLRRQNAVKLARLEKAKIEELLKARTNFFTNVSHEFRTPLTLILSPIQQLTSNRELMSNPEWREHLTTISYNGESLMRLANDFLNFSKSESRALKLDLQYERLDLLLEKLTKQLVYMARSRNVKLNYSDEATPIALYFDAAHIEQIIYNLGSNAIKHTPIGGEVTIRLYNAENSVTIEVEDSGVGIPLDMQPHIFERFVSRDSIASNESSGIGIGLSLTKDLVELHSGDISFESREGVGTKFIVVLPKQSAEEIASIEIEQDIEQEQTDSHHAIDVETSVTSPESTNSSEGDGERDIILIVDDNEQIVNLLRQLFSKHYKVITATNGEDALRLSNSIIPDLIISDIMMPGMDGYELCQRVKGSGNTSHIPIILLSAKGTTEDVAMGYRYRADSYCVKPFDNDILTEMVRSLLDNRRILESVLKHSDTPIDEVDQYNTTSDADKLMVARFVSFVEENIGNPDLLVSDVCSAVGLTQVVLNKKLKSLFNMTANTMIRNIRLKRAAELLRTGRYTVSSVTYDVGFNDLRHFRESFLKRYGMFPQAYKKSYSEDEK